jgi:hypothetical protein
LLTFAGRLHAVFPGWPSGWRALVERLELDGELVADHIFVTRLRGCDVQAWRRWLGREVTFSAWICEYEQRGDTNFGLRSPTALGLVPWGGLPANPPAGYRRQKKSSAPTAHGFLYWR